MNDEQKEKIQQITKRWPSIRLSDSRALRYRKKKKSFYNNFEILKSFKYENQIAIDGMSSSGKTTMLQNMNRINGKINIGSPYTTHTSKYNNDMKRSWLYLEYQYKCEGKHVIWDRSCFSNIIFSIVHFLMYKYKNKSIPKKKEKVYPLIEYYIQTTQIESIINYMINRENYIPIIFLVNSNMQILTDMLKKRNTIMDFASCFDYNYHMAQYMAFSNFAERLEAPIFDIGELYENFKYSLDDIQCLFKNLIDIDDDLNDEKFLNYYYGNEAKIYELTDPILKKMIYAFSKK